jgi:hypothetical protein
MDNPIPKATRNVIYLIGLCVSAAMTVVGPVIAVLDSLGHLDAALWTPVLLSAVGAVGTVTNILAKANLGGPAQEG